MKRPVLFCLAAAIFACGNAVVVASAETPGPPVVADSLATPNMQLEWNANYASWYSFQGLDYSQGQPVLQPEMSASLHGLSLGLWGNLDQRRHELNEVDATFQAEREVGPVTGTVGYAYLRYPHRDWEATHEIIGEIAFAGPVPASLNLHWDVAAGKGRYWTLALSRDATLRAITTSLGAKLYVQEHYYGQSGFPALETSVGVSTRLAGVVLQPSLSRIWGWDNRDFRGDMAIHSSWIMSVAFSSP